MRTWNIVLVERKLILLLSIIILHNYGNYDITATRLQNVFLVTGSRVVLYGYIRTMKTYMVNQPSYSSTAKCNIFSLTSSSFYPEIIKCHILLSKVFSSEILQIMHISIIRKQIKGIVLETARNKASASIISNTSSYQSWIEF